MCLLWIVFKKYDSRLSVIFRWWVLWVRMSFKRLVLLSIVNGVNIVNIVKWCKYCIEFLMICGGI